jgi:hypothetical protein
VRKGFAQDWQNVVTVAYEREVEIQRKAQAQLEEEVYAAMMAQRTDNDSEEHREWEGDWEGDREEEGEDEDNDE